MLANIVKTSKLTINSGVNAKDVFGFIQSLVASIAWPVTAIVIALLLKKPIQDAINRLNKFKYGDAEASFERELQNLKDTAEAANIVYDERAEIKVALNKTLLEEVQQVASISPSAAIPLAWSQVESEITDLTYRTAISPDSPSYNSPSKNVELLKKEGYLDLETYQTIVSMRQLRNSVAHSYTSGIKVSVQEAIEYGKLAEAVSKRLKEIRRK
ncbi:hypothetical protein [Hymenobacter properus]|uniref:DUF4145 domain-containing protein n=1 Tax=Hymenobacter properus TaxID=2791026 RepID=A0A931FLH8_9BACT|nr:hypothetical protein [Hymenobacter properus]MBF9142051.1 hypothetical protein [Hymenobacter properus]MBR7720858.1 hypothetical protein [Microvirga sp. SRT04]